MQPPTYRNRYNRPKSRITDFTTLNCGNSPQQPPSINGQISAPYRMSTSNCRFARPYRHPNIGLANQSNTHRTPSEPSRMTCRLQKIESAHVPPEPGGGSPAVPTLPKVDGPSDRQIVLGRLANPRP